MNGIVRDVVVSKNGLKYLTHKFTHLTKSSENENNAF